MTTVYIYETILILVVAAYVWNFFQGRNKNRQIAQRWVQANSELFEEQFSVVSVNNCKVGINEEGAHEPYKLLDQESANIFKFFASGRVNCKYAMTTIELQRRQVKAFYFRTS